MQRAEIFAYRGMVLHRSGNWEEANKVFSAAITMSEDLGMGWEAWAVYVSPSVCPRRSHLTHSLIPQLVLRVVHKHSIL